MRFPFSFALASLIGLALTLPAAAQDAAPSHGKKARDPNEVICEKQEVLGSRLATRKICMTRSQWDEQRHSDRELLEKSQTNGCVAGAGC